jgi:thymidylate synthase (FAD)
MKIIKPSFKFSNPYQDRLTPEDGLKMLRFIELQARISHRSEDKQTGDTWKKFIEAVVIKHGDWSVTEHCSITATIRTDRGVTHELVRHRLFSFTQESTRFVRYKAADAPMDLNAGMEFIYPEEAPEGCFANWDLAMSVCEDAYRDLLKAGWRPQEARSVLPNALAATIAVTGNLRNWRHFFLMRTSKETHPDFKRITIPMLAEFQRIVPLLYDDIVPENRQVDNLRLVR